MEPEVKGLFLSRNKSISSGGSFDEPNSEMKSYSSGLKWVFLDYSNLWRAGLSWSIFFLLNIGVPLVSHFIYSCSNCDANHQRPYDAIVQIFLSLFAAVSFISLSSFGHRYGLRKFLFLDKLCDEGEKVRDGYSQQIQRSVKVLSAFVLPCFLAETAYKIWWFSSVGTGIPYFHSIFITKLVVCLLLIFSWLYRISICFLVCILFHLTCYLQLLRLNEFAELFERQSDVASILVEHLRIRRNLKVISHRFRLFILSTLILVTISQFIFLLVTTEPKSQFNIFTAGELALCSITLVTGLFICLRSAAKITHRALSVASLAAKWHACATINTLDDKDDEIAVISSAQVGFSGMCDGDTEDGDGDDTLNNTNLVPVFWNTLSYQKRQALVKYLEHNRAGITVYGFMLDRSWLHTIFAIQLSLTLWILNKTIGIS